MFKPTKYKLVNVGTGRVFEDEGWTIADPEATSPEQFMRIRNSHQEKISKVYTGMLNGCRL